MKHRYTLTELIADASEVLSSREVYDLPAIRQALNDAYDWAAKGGAIMFGHFNQDKAVRRVQKLLEGKP